MDTYSLMRHFADSWALLALFCFFVGTILFVLRPGSRGIHQYAARSILKDDDAALCEDARKGGGAGRTNLSEERER